MINLNSEPNPSKPSFMNRLAARWALSNGEARMWTSLGKAGAAAVLALVTTFGITLAVQSPAQAAYPCASGVSCLWNGTSYSGYVFTHVFSQRGNCYNLSASTNNQSDSIHNNSGRTMRYFKGADCTGSYKDFPNGYATKYLDLIGDFSWGDSISSGRMFY